MKLMPTSQKLKGFTLIELLIVITIIAILAAIGLVSYTTFLKTARDNRRQSDLKLIQSALEQYHGDQKYYPYTDSVILGSPLNNTTGGTSTTVTKTYLNAVPQDPKGSPNYSYKAYKNDGTTNCSSTDAGICAKYCVYAFLENPSPGLSGCSTLSGYNYAVTSP